MRELASSCSDGLSSVLGDVQMRGDYPCGFHLPVGEDVHWLRLEDEEM